MNIDEVLPKIALMVMVAFVAFIVVRIHIPKAGKKFDQLSALYNCYEFLQRLEDTGQGGSGMANQVRQEMKMLEELGWGYTYSPSFDLITGDPTEAYKARQKFVHEQHLKAAKGKLRP